MLLRKIGAGFRYLKIMFQHHRVMKQIRKDSNAINQMKLKDIADLRLKVCMAYASALQASDFAGASAKQSFYRPIYINSRTAEFSVLLDRVREIIHLLGMNQPIGGVFLFSTPTLVCLPRYITEYKGVYQKPDKSIKDLVRVIQHFNLAFQNSKQTPEHDRNVRTVYHLIEDLEELTKALLVLSIRY